MSVAAILLLYTDYNGMNTLTEIYILTGIVIHVHLRCTVGITWIILLHDLSVSTKTMKGTTAGWYQIALAREYIDLLFTYIMYLRSSGKDEKLLWPWPWMGSLHINNEICSVDGWYSTWRAEACWRPENCSVYIVMLNEIADGIMLLGIRFREHTMAHHALNGITCNVTVHCATLRLTISFTPLLWWTMARLIFSAIIWSPRRTETTKHHACGACYRYQHVTGVYKPAVRSIQLHCTAVLGAISQDRAAPA